MEILLLNKTTDADLSEGQKVAYADKSGEYTLTAKINNIYIDADGTALYNVAGASYMADELKLINERKICNSFDELREETLKEANFVEVSEDLFYYALGVVPPIYLKNGTWQMAEEVINNLYYTFGSKNDKYYGCLCNKNFAINNF